MVYYDKQTVNGDDIRGFVDLRKATRVQQVSQVINKKERPVLEIRTGTRTYFMAPDTINKQLTNPVVPKLQFILGWPVSEPSFTEEISSDTREGQEEVVASWLEVVSIQVKMELETKTFDVETVADSSETLPPKLKLRASPLDLALVDIVDPDQAYSWWSYRDIISWSCPIPNELHLSIRVPSANLRCVFKRENAMEVKALIEFHTNSIFAISAPS